MIERLGELELGNIVVGIKMLLLKEETKIWRKFFQLKRKFAQFESEGFASLKKDV